MTNFIPPNLCDFIEKDEGRKNIIYLDTKGIPTGGVGHAFKIGSSLPAWIWELIFLHDVDSARKDFEKLNLSHLSRRRQWVCISMIFQLGFKGFRGFGRTRRFLRRREYGNAADEMLRSKWYRIDTPGRAYRLSQIMRFG